jgi:hypothetical protein
MNGCISISASRVGSPMSFGAAAVPSDLNPSAGRYGHPMSFVTGKVGEEVRIEAKRTGAQMLFSAGLVCSLSMGLHLRVEPEYIWLLPENDFSEDVVVYANVSWTIE